MIKYATIGRGTIAETFIEGARLTGRFSLEAVYSRNEETGREFAEKHGAKKVYTTLEDLCADEDIEAVYIASPNVCHFEQSKALLLSGKHVICEKPITTNAKAYALLKDIADSEGLIYMEAIIPIYTKFREAIKDALGEIGNISMAKLDFCQRSSRYDAFMAGEEVNIFDMSLHAGTLMDLGVYCVYAAVDLLGMPKSITASASYLRNGCDGSGSAIFGYDGFTAVLSYSKTGQSTTPSEIVGDRGSLQIGRIGLYAEARLIKDGETADLTPFTDKPELMGMEASAFADFIEGKDLDKYAAASRLCIDVHTCMDEIKKSANITSKYG